MLGEGVLYEASLAAGTHRLYLYHVNGLTEPMRFLAVASNAGDGNVRFRIQREALEGPSANYLAVGRAASERFLAPPVQTLAGVFGPGDVGPLDNELLAIAAARDQLVNGIYRIETDGPMRVTVMALRQSTPTFPLPMNLPPSADDGDNREGTFAGTTRSGTYAWSTESGMARLRIGDGGEFETDPPLSGVDEEDGAARLLRGNYGVEYAIDVDVSAPDGQRFAVLLNPRGGNYGGAVETTFGPGPAVMQLVPEESLVVPPTTEAGVVGIYDPFTVAGDADRLTIRLTPAGASSLAIDLLLVPFGGPREKPLPPAGWMLY
ncbi:MAG: hypothetical protein RLY93_02330 [Sumerlaeia bacterium]